MPLRVTDTPTSSNTAAQISTARNRIAIAQQQIATGKRINRPADNPQGAAAVINLRTTQAEIDQMKRNAGTAGDTLLATDADVDAYERLIDRARTLLTQGGSDSTPDGSKDIIATEIDGLRSRMLSIANLQRGGLYVFGGTRQSEAPFDPSTAVGSAIPSSERKIRTEPSVAPTTVGFLAEGIFADATGTIFSALETVATALRGTADPVADKAAVLAGLDRLESFASLGGIARARIGSGLNAADSALERMNEGSLATEIALQRIEASDFAEAALMLTEGQTILQAIIQSRGSAGRTSLIDYLG